MAPRSDPVRPRRVAGRCGPGGSRLLLLVGSAVLFTLRFVPADALTLPSDSMATVTPVPPPIDIDHVYLSDGLQATRVETVPVTGTDHLGLLVTIGATSGWRRRAAGWRRPADGPRVSRTTARRRQT